MSKEKRVRERPMNKGCMRLKIMTTLADEGAMTSTELCEAVNPNSESSMRTAISELTAKGWVRKVHVLTAEGREAVNRCEDE